MVADASQSQIKNFIVIGHLLTSLFRDLPHLKQLHTATKQKAIVWPPSKL